MHRLQPAREFGVVGLQVQRHIRGHLELTTLRSNELALTHASWDLDGTAPDGTRTQLSGTGTIVSRRGPDGTWRIVLDDPQSGPDHA